MYPHFSTAFITLFVYQTVYIANNDKAIVEEHIWEFLNLLSWLSYFLIIFSPGKFFPLVQKGTFWKNIRILIILVDNTLKYRFTSLKSYFRSFNSELPIPIKTLICSFDLTYMNRFWAKLFSLVHVIIMLVYKLWNGGLIP